jgi:hypothetical protein
MIADIKIVLFELCDIGNSVGFHCFFRENRVFCLRKKPVGRSDGGDNLWFMRISDIVLVVENGVVSCFKSRFCDHRKVSWCLSDPGSFDCILGWFREQVRQYDPC